MRVKCNGPIAALVATLILLSSLVLPACHAPVTITTPAGHAAYAADQIVTRLNQLEDVAIQAAGTGGLPVPTAKVIVRFCVAADRTIQAQQKGWANAVATAWEAMKQQLPTITNPAILALISSLDVALAAWSAGD
jgi:hypothetical protein